MIVAAAVAQVQARPQILELDLDGSLSCSLSSAQLGVVSAVVLVDIGAQAMPEHKLQSFPGVFLACHNPAVLPAICQIELPEVGDPLRGWSVQLPPDLLGYYPGEARVSRASRDSTAILAASDRDGKLSSMADEFIAIASSV